MTVNLFTVSGLHLGGLFAAKPLTKISGRLEYATIFTCNISS